MNDLFYLDRLDDWLDGMNTKELKELDYKYLGDTQVQLGHYEEIYEKGLDLIQSEKEPKKLLLKVLDEYTTRFADLPNFDSDLLNNGFDDETKEKLKSLVLFGTQAALIKENSRIQQNLRTVNQNYRDLLSVITHEFKNSLTSIYGYNRIIDKRISEGRTDDLKDITGNVDRLSKKLFSLIETLLNMSLIEQEKLIAEKSEYKLLKDVVDPLVRELEFQLHEKGMVIEVISKEDDVLLNGDPALLQVALRNLAVNAIQYGFEKTDIEIRLEKVRDRVLIEVFNKGQGLEKKHLSHIFEKFSRFHTKYRQTNVGIGLFTVKHIIELHDGSIVAESKQGEWMRFLINLPIN
ncbi:MAG: sensor histidine kinase [Calditrichaeota bacterium]|nr:MAG: sensor histidine kinase [Calditrichota bacterium]MBL1203853.1 sensor histidine kinase [Calditrichota bacterium]NOG43685.1 HAMP domain-containing histidine kinase [Calditrichota bacterium]